MRKAQSDVPRQAGSRIVIASNDDALCDSLLGHCAEAGHSVDRVRTLDEMEDRFSARTTDLVLLDRHLLGSSPETRLEGWLNDGNTPAILLIAGKRDDDECYALISRGVRDVLNRPPLPAEVQLRIARVLEARDLGVHLASLESAITEKSFRSYTSRSLVAKSPVMRQLQQTIDRVAAMRMTVLVRGESGVGKELVARALHFQSGRRDGPFVTLNCAALPSHLIESELFGHERGAFTGAFNRRAGKFELAHNGTLFLDEVGETDLSTQAKLLRVLEHQEFMRVGGTRPVRANVRLLAATNADLERLVRETAFREDLYYRLRVVTLEVPPLRERHEDIEELCRIFLDQISRANMLRPRRLTKAALDVLMSYPWPGNVRELLNTLEAIVVATPHETIDVVDLPGRIRGLPQERSRNENTLVGRALKEIEAEAIRATLFHVGGSRTEAARILGIGLRTLRRKIRDLQLDDEIPAKPGRPRSTRESEAD